MQNTLKELINYFKYQNGLKSVLRNNWMPDGRKESSAEHSWSVSMMAWLLTDPLEKELGIKLDHTKIIKMALIHDVVEIDAGDIGAWDDKGREEVESKEYVAIDNVSEKYFNSGDSEIKELWVEHEKLETVESKLVKACDQLCPLIYRLVFKCDYKGTGVDRVKLDGIFLKIVGFSKITHELYIQLAEELGGEGLFDG